MTQKRKSGDRQMEAFEASLTKILGVDNFLPETVGDLSMLLDALRRAVNGLTGLMEFRRSFERSPAAKLQELEINLDDVRDLVKDLGPSLRKMTKAAYRVCEVRDDEEKKTLRRIKRRLKKVESFQQARIKE